MPKRKNDLSKEDRWLRKLKKYENKIKNSKRQRIIYSSDEDVSKDSNDTDLFDTPIIPHETPHVLEEVVPDTLDKLSHEPEPDIDLDLLQTLGDFQPETVEWGEDLLEAISKRFQYILLNGLKKEVKEDLNKRYLFPKNVPLSKAPILNLELSSMLSDTYKGRDKRIQTKQDQLGRAISALGMAMSTLMVKNPNIQDVMRKLNDCSQLIADSHFTETYTRRSLVIPLVDKSLIDPLKERQRDQYLFGENLGEMVKNSRGIKRTGNLMQGVSINSANLNWKGPPTRTRLPRQSYHNRGGGQRTMQYVRGRRVPPQPSMQRRAGAPLPPPPPAPPAQPARRQPAQLPRRQPPPM